MTRTSIRLCTLRASAVLVILCMPAMVYAATITQQLDPTSRELKHFTVAKLSLLDALLQLGQEQNIPLGIEYIDVKAVTEPISIDIGRTTVAQALDVILARQPGYSWSVREGVVCISHLSVPKGRLNLLDRILTEFSIQRMSVTQAGIALFMSLDKELHPGNTGWAGSYAGDISPTQIGPLSLHEVTVREALNRMVKEAGDAAWVVQVRPGNLDELPPYGLWRIIQYENPPKLYGPLFEGILRHVTPHGTPQKKK